MSSRRYYERNPEEFKRFITALKNLTTRQALRLLIYNEHGVGQQGREVADALNIEGGNRLTLRALSMRVVSRLNTIDLEHIPEPFASPEPTPEPEPAPEPEPTPEPAPEPEPEPEPEPDTPERPPEPPQEEIDEPAPEPLPEPETPDSDQPIGDLDDDKPIGTFVPPMMPVPFNPFNDPTQPRSPIQLIRCDGCGGVGHSPRFLRWAKVARGEPVTVSYDPSNAPASLNWLTLPLIMFYWCKPWEHMTSIRFRPVTQGRGDIHISFRYIDGVGRVLGMAYSPRQSIDFMERGGDLSGDIFIDRGDRWSFPEQVHAVGLHEVGHAIGIPHLNPNTAVMFFQSDGRYRILHNADLVQASNRYPPTRIIGA